MHLVKTEQKRYPRTSRETVHLEGLPPNVTVEDGLYWHPPEFKDVDGPGPYPHGWVDGPILEYVINPFVNGKELEPLRYPIRDRDIPTGASPEDIRQEARGRFAGQIVEDVRALMK